MDSLKKTTVEGGMLKEEEAKLDREHAQRTKAAEDVRDKKAKLQEKKAAAQEDQHTEL